MNFQGVILSVVVGLGLSPMTAFAHNKSNSQANADSAQAIEKEMWRLEEVGSTSDLLFLQNRST